MTSIKGSVFGSTMNDPLSLEERQAGGVVRLTLARPELHNAFNDDLIEALSACLDRLAVDAGVRAVVLAAQGKSFSAGADLNWMKRMADYDEARNLADARALAGLMRRLNDLPKPTVALVQGSAFGGGVGLIACCDIVLAVPEAVFALTEVRLGLIPAVISPFVAAAIGPRAARRYFLTAERLTAEEARDLGLVHEVVPADKLESRGAEIIAALAKAGPESLAAAKDLLFGVAGRAGDPAVDEETARRIARVRGGAEAREGIAAFLEKRKPAWTGEP